jgi:serine/threonine protein kinase
MEASADRRLVAGRYVLGGPLGRGGMGTVWRADDALLGRPVAVKEVELPAGSPGAGSTALRERALREARAAARLNHPGVVTLHDVVEADGRLFLVMELVESPTLRDLVERSGPLPPATAARVGLELLEALDAAHRAGIVHHDVKPANVMVTADGRTKLADFGIASLQDDTQRTLGVGAGDRTMTAAFGSLPYAAPEQAGDRRAGPAADLWALGATLWFAVEGAAPFERASPAATLGAILHDPPGRPWRAGPLEPVLLALLAKDPRARPPAAVLRRMLAPLAAAAHAPTVPMAGTARLPSAQAPTEALAGPAPPPGWGAPRHLSRGGGAGGGGCWSPPGCWPWCRWRPTWGRPAGAGPPARPGWATRSATASSSSWSARSTAGSARSAGAWPPSARWSSSAYWPWGSRTPGPRAAPSAAAASTCSTPPASATTPTWTPPSATATAGSCPPTSTRASACRARSSTTSPTRSTWPGSSCMTAPSAAGPASSSAEPAGHQ